MIIEFLQAAMIAGVLLFPFIAFVLFVSILFFTTIIHSYLLSVQVPVNTINATTNRQRPRKRFGIFLLSFAIATGIVFILSLFGMVLLSGFIPGFD